MSRRTNGRPDGEAFVVFKTEKEAEDACETLHKQEIYGRWMELQHSRLGEMYAKRSSLEQMNITVSVMRNR